MLVVEGGHIGVGHGDLGDNLLVNELFNGQVAAQVAPQIVQGLVGRLQLRGELFLGVGGLHLRQLGVDILRGCAQVHLGRALRDDLLVDELADHLQAERVSLLRRGLLGLPLGLRLGLRLAELHLVHAVHVGAHDGVAIHAGHHVGAMRAVATRNQQERHQRHHHLCAGAARAPNGGGRHLHYATHVVHPEFRVQPASCAIN